jgi:hypothetical protein
MRRREARWISAIEDVLSGPKVLRRIVNAKFVLERSIALPNQASDKLRLLRAPRCPSGDPGKLLLSPLLPVAKMAAAFLYLG